jgi:hypothetical protein
MRDIPQTSHDNARVNSIQIGGSNYKIKIGNQTLIQKEH